MTTIAVKTLGFGSVSERLAAMRPKVHAAIKSELEAWATELAGYIKQSKLSGDPLHRRTGNLSGSIAPYVKDDGNVVEGGAAGGKGVVYAHIHEFGGTIHARMAPYLAFKTLDGRWHRVKQVVMPQRSYMRSAFEEQQQSGMDGIKAAVRAVVEA